MQVDHTILRAVQVCGPGNRATHATLAGLLAGQLLDGCPLQALQHSPHDASLRQQPQIHWAVQRRILPAGQAGGPCCPLGNTTVRVTAPSLCHHRQPLCSVSSDCHRAILSNTSSSLCRVGYSILWTRWSRSAKHPLCWRVGPCCPVTSLSTLVSPRHGRFMVL